jgi:hypothetical protein
MTLEEAIKLEAVFDKRKSPYDILEFLDTTYYSKSKDKEIRYGDIHVAHFIRIFQKQKEKGVSEFFEFIKGWGDEGKFHGA